MKAENRRKVKAKKHIHATRRGIILISVLAVLILIINIITASFSWFTPQVWKNPQDSSVLGASGMEYKKDTYNRSEKCNFSTSSGTKQTVYESGKYIDQINYGEAISYATVAADGGKAYFRTSVINYDASHPSDVSLYFASLGETGSNLIVAVTYPSNTVRTVSGENNDFCLVRNAYVKRHDTNDVDGPGLLQIDWFVTNNSGSDIILNLDPESNGGQYANMYLMYN